jgi:phosphoribosylanthranilate isomerase
MKIQVAGLSRPEDVAFAFETGVDAVGFTVGLPDGPHDGLTEEMVGSIVDGLPPLLATVTITYERSLPGLRRILRLCRTPVLQAHGDHDPATIGRLKSELPHLKVIKSISVVDESALSEVARWQDACDCLILDSVDPVTGSLGATGLVHDWGLSRRIVEASALPVILAGGLTPANVAEAIRRVRPWGVDVHTGVEVQGRLSRALLSDFVREARGAADPGGR